MITAELSSRAQMSCAIGYPLSALYLITVRFADLDVSRRLARCLAALVICPYLSIILPLAFRSYLPLVLVGLTVDHPTIRLFPQ